MLYANDYLLHNSISLIVFTFFSFAVVLLPAPPGGLPAYAIVLIVMAVVCVVGAGGVGSILYVRKQRTTKNGGQGGSTASGTRGPQIADTSLKQQDCTHDEGMYDYIDIDSTSKETGYSEPSPKYQHLMKDNYEQEI